MKKPNYCEAGSLDYFEAGARTRLSRERLMAAEDLAGRWAAWRVWAVCVEQTSTYSKGSDQVFLSAIADKAGVRRQTASALLTRFDELGIFGWRGTGRGRGVSLLSLPGLGEKRAVVDDHYSPRNGRLDPRKRAVVDDLYLEPKPSDPPGPRDGEAPHLGEPERVVPPGRYACWNVDCSNTTTRAGEWCDECRAPGR
jgi:hypothetical protein